VGSVPNGGEETGIDCQADCCESVEEQRSPTHRIGDNEGMVQAITRDPETMHGTPVFRGTRVPVQALFDYLEGGDTLEDFLEGFPTVSRTLAVEVLEEAKQLLLART
jgi:uncharacterized protein (DUF433 family)